MADRQRAELTEAQRAFLVEEYKNLADSFWRNEESGERRINFFISLVTAVVAALVALATSETLELAGGGFRGVAVGACLALLALGFFTLQRMVKRNRVTDTYKAAMAVIRARFALEQYEPFGPFGAQRHRRFGAGGLAETAALINSITVAALLAFLTLSWPPAAIAVAAGAGFAVALTVQAIYVNRAYRR